MKKKRIQIFYVLICLVLVLFSIVLFFQMEEENSEKEKNIILLQEKIDAIERANRTEPIFKQAEDVAPKEYIIDSPPTSKEYVGRWERVSMIINGSQEKFSPAILELNEGSFVKTTDCSISGPLSVFEDKMIMSVEKDGCSAGKNSFISNYNISLDKNNLIFSIRDKESQFEIIEGYKRIPTFNIKENN